MLTHIVCWKYKRETSQQQRQDHIEKLRALPNMIPNIVSFEVGADILHLERSFDTGLVAVYPDRAALDFYTKHPNTWRWRRSENKLLKRSSRSIFCQSRLR